LAPSVVVVILSVGGLWALTRRRFPLPSIEEADCADWPRRRRAGVALVAGGTLELIVARGRLIIPQLPDPLLLLQGHVPGLAAIREPAQFAVVFLLVLSMLASLGLSTLLSRLSGIGRRPLKALVAVAAIVAVGIECYAPVPHQVLDISPDALAVYRDLAKQGPGAVLELPMGDVRTIRGALLEAPRMVYSTLDWHLRVNGYSGFIPPEYTQESQVLNSFPSPAALLMARQLRVRYVVLEVGIRHGIPEYAPADAQAVVTQLPAGTKARLDGSAWLVDLGPVPPGRPPAAVATATFCAGVVPIPPACR